jgi:hypothetical protein
MTELGVVGARRAGHRANLYVDLEILSPRAQPPLEGGFDGLPGVTARWPAYPTHALITFFARAVRKRQVRASF